MNNKLLHTLSMLLLAMVAFTFTSCSLFDLEEMVEPHVTTADVTNVSVTSATVGGNVTSEGWDVVKERGIVYSTSPNPTTADTKLVKGSGTGSFSIDILDIKDGTTYYVRAYAINVYGTSYGEQKSFTTRKANMPNVTTSDVTNVYFTAVTVGGEVTSDGGMPITECGVVYSTSPNPTTANSKETAGSGTGSFSIYLSGLSEGTTYYLRAYAINSKGTSYGEQKSFTTKNSSGSVNGHDWVDLGLSVKWATCNVGADSPEDYGDYFAWGETQPKTTYDWSTYKWCYESGSYTYKMTKYCNKGVYGTVDNKTQLDLSDDAARANWGGSWRMPTRVEWWELREKCTWTYTTQNGVEGVKVTSKTNGRSIFLPFAYLRNGSSLSTSIAPHFYYWLSSLSTAYPNEAECMYCSYTNNLMVGNYYRYFGLSVRPVCP